MFPKTRMRRNRLTEGRRRLTCRITLTTDDLILPLFLVEGNGRKESIESMPGVCRISVDLLEKELEGLKIPAVLLFAVPETCKKDNKGEAALDSAGIVPPAIRQIKQIKPELVVITDVCLCSYTTHGHCGIIDEKGRIDNDASVGILAAIAKVHAQAGADIVAPSAMMDGQVKAIRDCLDKNGFIDTAIMSYAAKFASSFYGPFRDAAKSTPEFGDRKSYQLPPVNRREAIRDALLDEAEGADWLMVKPGLPYMDILNDLRQRTLLPIAAYHVSGEYIMIKHAAKAGSIDEKDVVIESMTALKRAGADAIITYYARELSEWLCR
ncbi:MAG: porphobilinogen synthase [Phycisphaerae bacterium]|nr:porphobilinogen synthase [Phycisphaerae bacterium]